MAKLFCCQNVLSFSAEPVNANKLSDCKSSISGQSYKGSMIVNYDSRVVIWGNFKSGTTLES